MYQSRKLVVGVCFGDTSMSSLARQLLQSLPYLNLQSTQYDGLQVQNQGYMGHYFGYFGVPGTSLPFET